MKRFALIMMILFVTIALAACTKERGYEDCTTPDGTMACWNAEDENFRWEEDAVIEIGVDSDTMGAALVEKWNQDFPELANKLVYRYYGSVNGTDAGVQGLQDGQGEAPDVALVIDNEVIGKEAALFPLHEYFEDLGSEQTLKEVYDLINKSGVYFMSAFYDGMSFSWNKTMIEQLGISTADANGDNLPDAFDTWEEIFAIAEGYTERPEFTFTKKDGTAVEKTILEFFPISLSEAWSGYSSLTAGGWRLFGSNDYTNPGFDDAEFLGGLEFIKAFSETNMSVDETGAKKAASAMGWRWDSYLDGDYPFALVGTWMDVDGKEEENNLDFKFSPMPTYDGGQPAPLVKTKGFAINAYTEFPSAASEVLRWLYTQDILELMINSSAYLPALNLEAEIYPQNIESENKSEFAAGMALNAIEPVGTLPNAPTVRAMNLYYNIGITDFFIAVWDGTKTPAQAQTEIVSTADAWIEANNVAS